MNFNKLLGNNLRNMRLAIGLNQEVLAHILATSPQTISRYEHGVGSISCSKLYEVTSIMMKEMAFDRLFSNEAHFCVDNTPSDDPKFFEILPEFSLDMIFEICKIFSAETKVKLISDLEKILCNNHPKI